MAGDVTGWVKIFAAGVRRGELYTTKDLDDIVANFRRFRGQLDPSLVIGHSEDQKWLEDTGLPAVGWPTALRRNGIFLEARFEKVPPLVQRLIERGAYRKVSAEIYDEDSPPEGIPLRGKGLRRVALLGGELPHVKSLGDVDALWKKPVSKTGKRFKTSLAYSERVKLPGGTWAVFCEVRTMAEENGGGGKTGAEAIANAAILDAFPGLPPEFVESLTPDQLDMLVPAVGGAGDMEPLEEPAPEEETFQEFPVEAPDRDSLIAALAEMGQDPAALEAMTDEELIALWEQLQAEAEPVEMSEGGIDMNSAPISTDRQPKKVTVTQAFSEARVKAAEKRLRHIEAIQRQRLAQERKATVAAFCECMVREGRLSPAQAERGKGPVFQRLMRADASRGVAKFGERVLTELDLQMQEIEKAPPRRFGEQIPDPLKQSSNFDDRVQKHYEGRLARLNGRN